MQYWWHTQSILTVEIISINNMQSLYVHIIESLLLVHREIRYLCLWSSFQLLSAFIAGKPKKNAYAGNLY